MNTRLGWLLTAAMLAVASSVTCAQPAAVTARDVWARATAPDATNGVLYMVLSSPAGDHLTTVSTPAAAKAVVHDERVDYGIIRMRPLPGGLDLPPGQPVFLRPGSFHIMLEGLKSPLHPGDTVPVHVTFAKSPPIDITARVLPIGSAGQAGMSAMPGMHMPQSAPPH